MLYCFLDTNIFLQFQAFDQVDWAKILGVKEVCLVVPFKVIQELDKKKTDNSNRLRRRANSILPKLYSYGEQSPARIRQNVELLIQLDHPPSEWLRERGYDPEVPDDVIVGSVDYYRTNNPTFDVLLLSDDTGPRLKARHRGIRELAPLDEIRLSEEPDPVQKELEQTKQELFRIKNAQPKLSLGFSVEDDLKSEVEFEMDFSEDSLSTEDIEKLVARRKSELTYTTKAQSYEHSDVLQTFTLNNPTGAHVTDAEIQEYHTKVNKYLQKFTQYLTYSSLFKRYQKRTRSLNIVLVNDGNSPADDIDIDFYFPDGFKLSEEYIHEPESPELPEKPKPKTTWERMMPQSYTTSLFPYLPSSSNTTQRIEPPDSSGFTIRKTNSYEVHNDLKRLKHAMEYPFEPLYVTFEPPSKFPKVFEVTYQIIAANLPDPVDGKLLIRLVSQT